MSFFSSTLALFYVLLFVLSVCSFAFAAPMEITEFTRITEENDFYKYTMSVLLQLDGTQHIDGGQNKIRVKRNGAGRFSDAASMGPMKTLQLFFAFFKNIFTTDPIGGNHPMSRSIPKPVVMLFKQTIIAAFFPNLNKDH